MNFKGLVIWSWQYQLSVRRQWNGSNSTRMLLDYLWVTFNSVVPKSNCAVCAARCDNIASLRHFDIVDVAFMANEAEWAHCWFEVPDHDRSIGGSRDDLFEIRIECYFLDCVFMTFERSFKSWISSGLALCHLWLHFFCVRFFLFFLKCIFIFLKWNN